MNTNKVILIEASPLDIAKSKVTPDQYAEFLRQLELVDVFLLDYKVNREIDAIESMIGCQSGPSMEVSESNGFYNIEAKHISFGVNKYGITVLLDKEELLKAEISVCATLRYINEPFDENTFSIYNDLTLNMMLFPYVRTILNSALTDCGFPKFTLPMKKRIRKQKDDSTDNKSSKEN